MEHKDDFADLLEGARAIAGFTKKTYRQTVYKLQTNQIPGWKIGAVWYSTKSKIRARLMGEDGGSRAA
jgi:hypothetical protein